VDTSSFLQQFVWTDTQGEEDHRFLCRNYPNTVSHEWLGPPPRNQVHDELYAPDADPRFSQLRKCRECLSRPRTCAYPPGLPVLNRDTRRCSLVFGNPSPSSPESLAQRESRSQISPPSFSLTSKLGCHCAMTLTPPYCDRSWKNRKCISWSYSLFTRLRSRPPFQRGCVVKWLCRNWLPFSSFLGAESQPGSGMEGRPLAVRPRADRRKRSPMSTYISCVPEKRGSRGSVRVVELRGRESGVSVTALLAWCMLTLYQHSMT